MFSYALSYLLFEVRFSSTHVSSCAMGLRLRFPLPLPLRSSLTFFCSCLQAKAIVALLLDSMNKVGDDGLSGMHDGPSISNLG